MCPGTLQEAKAGTEKAIVEYDVPRTVNPSVKRTLV
jgi:hypothetical protein